MFVLFVSTYTVCSGICFFFPFCFQKSMYVFVCLSALFVSPQICSAQYVPFCVCFMFRFLHSDILYLSFFSFLLERLRLHLYGPVFRLLYLACWPFLLYLDLFFSSRSALGALHDWCPVTALPGLRCRHAVMHAPHAHSPNPYICLFSAIS
jgi:hypothetical protein